ncbi:MAG: hypothetical protein ACE5FG_05460 [Myxococcota bacterium]
MARIVGNLVPEDDYTHPLGPEPNFNESMYFNFFDAERSIGGFLRLGNRANEGRAEMTVAIYLPDGRVLFAFDRLAIEDNERFDAGGLRFEVQEPTQRLRSEYRGSVIELSDPRRMADPGRAFKESPRREIELDLAHEAVGPLYGHSESRPEADRPAEQQFARAHYEQHMSVSGHLDIGDERHTIRGYGLRDHSWGPRSWQAIDGYEWLTLSFGRDLGAMVSVIRREGREERRGGVLVRGDRLDPLQGVAIDVEYEENGLYHRSLKVCFETPDGEPFEVRGEVQGFLPLRNRRAGRTTHIGEGLTRWQLGERVGYGLSELLRQI